MVLPFSDSHNMVANLNASHSDAKDFRQIISFLQQSEIHYALTASPTIFENHIRTFWSTAQFNIRDDRRFLNASIEGKVIEVTEHTIRHVLKLESRETYEMSNPELVAVLQKMGYEGDAYNLKMIKSQVSYNWRFLWHVIIHVFAARKAGWDNLTVDLAKGMACLCLGRPYNWARFILENMKANAQGSLKNKFLLYPRFVELIIMEKLKDITFEGRTLVLSTMRDRVWKIMKTDHARSAFSGRFTPLFQEMLQIVGELESESESEEEEEETDRRKTAVESSETESASPSPIRRAPRIILKKSSAAPSQKRQQETPPEALRPKRIRTLRESPLQTVQSESFEDKSLKDLIVKLANDFETFQREVIHELKHVSVRLNDNTNEVWRLKAEVGKLAGLVEKSSTGKSADVDAADEDVIVIDEPSEAEKKRDDDERAAGDTELNFDYSFLDEERIPAGAETVLTETRLPESVTVRPPFWTVKDWYGKGKGKEIAEDSLCGFREIVPDLDHKIVNKAELLKDEFSVLLDLTLIHPDPRVVTFSSKTVYANPSEWVVKQDLAPIWLSSRDNKKDTEIVGRSSQILIEDVDVESEMMEEEIRLEISKRLKDAEKDARMIVMAEKRLVVEDRMKTDEFFRAVVERMMSYLGDNAESILYRSPDEIIRECFERDCNRIVSVIYESFQSKPLNEDQISADLMVNVSTLSASLLKDYLRRYDYASYQINRMSIEQMIEEAKEIQLHLLKKLPRNYAEMILDKGLFDVPKDFENRARFFSSQYPQLSTHRIVHWKFDDKRGCYMIKRVTGATHVFYSVNEVARLTEEDLYELADLRIDDTSDSDEVFQFCRFLWRQKKKDFEAINFSHQDSIRPHTIAYLRSEGMSLREILKDQYLCLKFEHIPKMSAESLLDDLKRWFLDDKSYELVFERSGRENIKIYHPAELNMFTREDLVKIASTSPHGKREWNAHILEMIVNVAENLIKRFPVPKVPDEPKAAEKEKKKTKRKKTREPERRAGGVRIQD